MIPITVALVGRESMGEASNRWRPLLLTLSYVIGVALVYAILGVIAGMTGSIFGSISSNPWLYFLQANVLLLAGLFMLDVFTAQAPDQHHGMGQPRGQRRSLRRRVRAWDRCPDSWPRPAARRSWRPS